MILPSINLIAGCTLVRIPNYVLYLISEILFIIILCKTISYVNDVISANPTKTGIIIEELLLF